MAELEGVEYLEEKIRRWRANRKSIVESLGERYYLDHLERFKVRLVKARDKNEC